VPLETSVNAYLINTGSKIVLVDTGTAGLFGPTAGRVLANLKASGYAPEQVDEVVITHMHGDHIGGAGAFPNATLRLDKRDADFWLAPSRSPRATAPRPSPPSSRPTPTRAASSRSTAARTASRSCPA
jgi:glyoxylase-like metal-dependent hydrolase (beta-lactamase superfamily II)